MECNYTMGCICGAMNVDDERFIDLSTDKQKEIITKIINETPNSRFKDETCILENIFENLVKELGVYSSSDDACDCCGDTIDSWDLKIE